MTHGERYIEALTFGKPNRFPHFNVDTDGNVLGLIPLMLEMGVTSMLPFEVQAGNDITQIRERYGQQLAIIGGIDKLALTLGKIAIDAELEAKLPLMVQTGGYIAGVDHRVVVETSYKNFAYFAQRVREYLIRSENS